MASQLLIEMPAEGASRLLTLSLLEQLTQHASAAAAATDPRFQRLYFVRYRTALRRLRASMTLYDDALGNSVPRKFRRRLRALANVAERLYRADVQAAWIGRYVPAPGQGDAPLGDGARAAIWLGERVGRRHTRALRALRRAQSDPRPLRRIAKRLGVYTTDVRLDAISAQQSFARLTSDQLIANADALGAALRAAHAAVERAALGRALRAAERLTYLLDPLRAYADVEAPIARLGELRVVLERLDQIEIVARALLRGGRRVAAAQAGEQLTAAIWPPAETPTSAVLANGRAPLSVPEIQRGIMVLAESLHDEVARALHELDAVWSSGAFEQLANEVAAVAAGLK